MKFVELGQGNGIPDLPPLTGAQTAAYLALYSQQFSSVEADKEYQEIISNGGVAWEDLLRELDEINRQSDGPPRSL